MLKFNQKSPKNNDYVKIFGNIPQITQLPTTLNYYYSNSQPITTHLKPQISPSHANHNPNPKFH